MAAVESGLREETRRERGVEGRGVAVVTKARPDPSHVRVKRWREIGRRGTRKQGPDAFDAKQDRDADASPRPSHRQGHLEKKSGQI